MLIYVNLMNITNYGVENVVMSLVVGYVFCIET